MQRTRLFVQPTLVTAHMRFDPLARLTTMRSDRLAWSCGALFAAVTFLMATVRYAGLHTSFYDLGVFEHFAYRLMHGDWSVLVAAWAEPIPYTHAQPIFALHALLYAVVPSPLTLVAVQSLTLALAFPLIERIADRLAPAPAPHLLPVLLFVSSPMWFQALFDFHTDHVAIPAALLAIRGIIERRIPWVLTGLVLMALVKENFTITAALLAGVGAVKLRSWTLASVGVILAGTGAWVIGSHLLAVTPAGAPALPAFRHLGGNAGEILMNLLRDPTMVVATFDGFKVRYLVLMFGPTLGLVVLGWPFLIPAMFTLGFVMLSTNASHSCTCTQYTAGVIPYLMTALAVGWARFAAMPSVPPRWVRMLPWVLLVVSAVVFVADAPAPGARRFILNKGMYGGARYLEGWRLGDANDAAAAIPPDAVVSVQNSLNASAFVRRPVVLPFPTGVFEPSPLTGVRAAFAVIDTTRDRFIVDVVEPEIYADAVSRLRLNATRVAQAGSIEVYRIP